MLNTFATFLYLVIYFVLFLRRKKMCDANIYSILFFSVSGFCRKPNRRRPKTLRNSLNKFCVCCLCLEEELLVPVQLVYSYSCFYLSDIDLWHVSYKLPDKRVSITNLMHNFFIP